MGSADMQDWRFDSAPADAERPYGWLDITVGPDSSVVYTQAQEPTAHGYDSMLALHLDKLSIASSINFEPFITADSCKVSRRVMILADISSRLRCQYLWNGMHNETGASISPWKSPRLH